MKNNNLDEMQEQQLLRIEHNACWLGFWGLFATVIIQAVSGARFSAFLGESILLLLLSGYIVTACLRHGIWDRKLTPDPKTNLLLSLGAGIFVGIICWMILARLALDPLPHLAISAILGGTTFALSAAALAICSKAYHNKQAQLEQE